MTYPEDRAPTAAPDQTGPPQSALRIPAGFWPSSPAPDPAPKKSRLPLIIAAAVGLILIIAATVAVTLFAQRGGGLSEPAAERACRTAFDNEWKQRLNGVAGSESASGVVVSLQGIDMQETWEVDGGYNVNGLVHYTLTTGLVAPVNDTIPLTCAATGTDDNVATTIANRG